MTKTILFNWARNLTTKKKPIAVLGLVLLMLSASPFALAVSSKDWMKKMAPKQRRSSQKQTTVAAVRGVDEPSEVDPQARDFESVKKVENKKFSKEQLEKFAAEGKLQKGQGAKP